MLWLGPQTGLFFSHYLGSSKPFFFSFVLHCSSFDSECASLLLKRIVSHGVKGCTLSSVKVESGNPKLPANEQDEGQI